jgi:hypothetical protein
MAHCVSQRFSAMSLIIVAAEKDNKKVRIVEQRKYFFQRRILPMLLVHIVNVLRQRVLINRRR